MIGLQGQVFCSICNKQYKDNNLPRILTMCGHTYCQLCISKMINKNISEEQADNGHPFIIECPEDGASMTLTVNQLKIFPKNLALLKVLEAKKTNSSFKDQSFNLSKIVKKQQIQEDDQTNDLIQAISECKDLQNSIDLQKQIALTNINDKKSHVQKKDKQQTKKQQAKEFEKRNQQQKCQDQLCLLHQKPLQIVCIRDNKKICSKCAIFGQHKGHQFKSIEQVENQKNQCYMQILQIFKQKQQIQQRMCNQQTKSGLIQILDKKRDIIQKQVRQQFRKLRQQITKQQKTVLKRLQQTYKTTEKKIHSLLQIQSDIVKNFSKWQVDSYQLLKVLQEPQIQAKVNALYSKQRKNVKILDQGNKILLKIQDQQKNLITKVEQILSHLSCKKDKQIYQNIHNFIEISDKVQKKIEQIKQSAKQKQSKNAFKNFISNDILIEKNPKIDSSIIDTFNQKQDNNDGSPLLQQSLLDVQESQTNNSDTSQHKIKNFSYEHEGRKPLQPNEKLINKNIQEDPISCNFIHLQLQSAKKMPPMTAYKFSKDQDDFLNQSRVSSILTSRPSMILKKQNGQRPNKKKLKSIKISQKYEKMMEGIYNNTVDTIDLTNAQVGDLAMLQICQFIKYSKARTIKLIRNKLSDSGIEKMLPALSNAQILNLSQNNLTQAVIDIFIKHRHGYLSGLKNLILSQNKIIERKHKIKIDQLRAMNIVVSV